MVGGLAVVLHGHPRLTADIDLVVDLDPAAARLAIRTLTAIGLRPRVPVDPDQFADPVQRKAWIEDRGMTVFNLYDPRDPLRSVDLFVEPPIPFDELWSRSTLITLPTCDVRVASIGDLTLEIPVDKPRHHQVIPKNHERFNRPHLRRVNGTD